MARRRTRIGRDQGYLVVQAFDKFAKALSEAGVDAVREAVGAIYETSQELVNVQTGALKSSGKTSVEVDRKAGKMERATGVISYGGASITTPNAPYGVVDYAAAVHAENPFLLNALQYNEGVIKGIVRKRFLGNGLERYGFKPVR